MSRAEGPPQYTKYRARPSLLRRRDPGVRPGDGGGPQRPGRRFTRPNVGWKRVAKYAALFLVAWVLVSFLIFLVSAQIEQGGVPDGVDAALADGGFPLFEETNILVLGSDQRSEETQEPGASTTGPSRSDSILLLRVGGGANSRMSIARDTLVDIPGAGRQKINAAYAIGGPALAIATISQYLNIPIHHVIEVSFEEFPDLIDAMGGIDYTGSCVVARINGGYRNGGVTVRIRAGEETHLDGEKALALARARRNECAPNENDLTRARRQQRILAAMRSRVLSPSGFIRLPWIAWAVPRAFRSDMNGFTLSAVFANLAIGGTPDTVVLGTPSGEVPEEVKERRVETFLEG